MLEIDARTQREKDIWNKDDIVLAQGFKRRIRGAFENPHGWKMEAERDRTIREKCRDAAVLDYGCYDGAETARYLEYGASVVYGIDISEAAIDRAIKSVRSARARFMVADAHQLPFEDGTFDLVVGRAILHHLDLSKAYGEIGRVLKPGGLAMFVEPLRGNPLAKIVRIVTPNARTKDERPLDYRDVKLGDDIVGGGMHLYSGFASAPLGALASLFGAGNDNLMTRVAERLDDAIGRTSLKYWGRVVYLTFKKR